MFGLGSLFGGAVDFVVDTAKSVFGGSSSSGGGRDYGGAYSSSSSSTVTNYDPDKVEVAKLENERVHLVKEAQLEIMEMQTKLEIVRLEAQCKGFQAIGKSIENMQKAINLMAEERFELLENASFQQIQQVEKLYAELTMDVNDNTHSYMLEKAPQLYALLQQYPEGSDIRQSFLKNIDQEVSSQIDFKVMQINQLEERRKIAVQSVGTAKLLVHEHIKTMELNQMDYLKQLGQSSVQLEFKGTALQLDAPQSNTTQIQHKPN